jgi:hypothetical protein
MQDYRGSSPRRTVPAKLVQVDVVWSLYRRWAIRNQIPLTLLDETIGRILYWTPCSNDREHSSRWREVLWGCLQLHQLAFDMATNPTHLDHHHHSYYYGTSVSVANPDRAFPATALRVAITILHSLSSVVQELVRDRSNDNDVVVVTMKRQATVRLWIERVRFLCRLSLLAGYWRRSMTNPWGTDPGIMLNGGMLLRGSIVRAPTIEEEAARVARWTYVGRRTGRRLGHRDNQRSEVLTMRERCIPISRLGVIVGEVLYICRPLVTAEADSLQVSELGTRKAWLLALAMDLLSLHFLRLASTLGNALTKAEIRRRTMRLFFYMLRAPIWDQATRPTIDRLDIYLQRVPLLGKILSNYAWECLNFWKFFGAEEG